MSDNDNLETGVHAAMEALFRLWTWIIDNDEHELEHEFLRAAERVGLLMPMGAGRIRPAALGILAYDVGRVLEAQEKKL